MSISREVLEDGSIVVSELPNDTEAAIRYIRSVLPTAIKNNYKYPPIVFIHQLYDIINDKALVNRQLNELQNLGKIQQFTIGVTDYPTALLLYEDYTSYTLKTYSDNHCVKKFLKDTLLNLKSFGVEKITLRQKLKLQLHEITELVNCGLLLIRNQESYWISFPFSGRFIRKYTEGRKYILQIIKRRKFHEILESDLEYRCAKVPKLKEFGFKYFLHDIKGSNDIKMINTTSGCLLRMS
ncbi:serine/threonine-protein kinase 19-like isoform X2 [Adelges cooleyi]|uniref:serine/threonine-protein kinase 19-like isoform X2 n=1 Tax=Adelges cooleyi TaxID=133065 RepID=UPI002180787A|nr:serine/threonine-protein kinase 19-like isoform X2 [Adelges cooleyi]XP_050428254.1 serine/threonine-protein kinase 19-like isoform X2 [Adelges cooleyi]